MGVFRGTRLTWYGHAAFSIRSPSGLRVLVDPWLENPKAPPGARDQVIQEGVDVILLTHGHSDHVGNTVEIAKATGAKVVAIYELMLFLARQGVPEEQLVGMNKWGSYRQGDLVATMVEATHSSGADVGGEVFVGGEAAGFVLAFDNGDVIYHAGDTGFTGTEEIIRDLFRPTVALVPIGDLFTMGPRLAAHFVRRVDPQVVVPIHWGTFPLLTGTPEALLKELGSAWKDRVRVLQPGESLE